MIGVVMCKKMFLSTIMWKHIAALYVPYQTFSLDKEENFNIMKDESHGKQSDHGVRCGRLLPFKSLTEIDQ